MTDTPNPSPPKHSGGKFRKGVSGNPGGKKKPYVPSQVVFNPTPPPQAPQVGPQAASSEGTHARVEQPKNNGRNSDGTFANGNSGSPGKPRGAKNHATRLVEALLDGQATELTNRAVELAMAGDASVMRALLDRLCPPRRERTVDITLPSIKSATDLIAAAAALTEATAAGDITPSEAASMSTLIGNVAKWIETVEIVARLAKLEEQLSVKGDNP